jgi:glycine cleavage system T protein (aminomethyltransferase)
MVDYGGWHMPVEYSGISAEHLAVRQRAGLFDVSHMGEIEVAGPDALRALQSLTCNDVSRLAVGQIQYSALTTPEGTFVDDILVYRLHDEHFLLVVNATNTRKDHAWIAARTSDAGDVSIVNASGRYALLALQGPRAAEILQPLTGIELGTLRYYWFATGEVAGVRVTVSRTGYTGEDGFEIFVPPAQADRVWRALLEEGRAQDIRPCGLGARDTLRLEACMRLYGNDMDETVTVLEAGLGWIVSWPKGEFLGVAPLRAQQAAGLERRLVAFEMIDRAIARHGHPVLLGGVPVGTVTSGTHTPYLKKAVGLAMVPVTMASAGTEIDIDVRGRCARARVVPEPFYKRPRPTAAGVGATSPARE